MYFWTTDGVVIGWEGVGRGGGGGGVVREDGGRNTPSQVGTIRQESGFWMQLIEKHFVSDPPPHLNLQPGSLQIPH